MKGTKLNERGVLVRLHISQWSGRKYDKQVSEETERLFEAEDAGRFNKLLVSSSELKKIQKAANEARIYHYEHTLPWSEDLRFLPSDMVQEYLQAIDELKHNFEDRVRDFINRYSELVEESRQRLGKMFREEDYPSESALKSKFDLSVEILPVPIDDFRVEVESEVMDALKEQVRNQLESSFEKSHKDLYQRLFKELSHLVDRLQALENEDKVDGRQLRDSVFTNILRAAEIVGKMNFVQDGDLEAIRKEIMKKIRNTNVFLVRDNKKYRDDVHKEAEEMARKLEAYL